MGRNKQKRASTRKASTARRHPSPRRSSWPEAGCELTKTCSLAKNILRLPQLARWTNRNLSRRPAASPASPCAQASRCMDTSLVCPWPRCCTPWNCHIPLRTGSSTKTQHKQQKQCSIRTWYRVREHRHHEGLFEFLSTALLDGNGGDAAAGVCCDAPDARVRAMLMEHQEHGKPAMVHGG